MNFKRTPQIPDGIKESLALLNQMDHCLLTGFSRLSIEQIAFFEKLGAIFSGTAFEQPLSDFVAACRITTFKMEDFVHLAAARSALNGAIYDALLGQVSTELNYHFDSIVATSTKIEHPLLTSCAEWLKEIALVGFESLQKEQLNQFSQTLDNLLENASFRPQSTLLTGLVNELSYSIPIGNGKPVPLRRWADLWSKAMMNCQGQLQEAQVKEISGVFQVLGSEILQHNNVVALRVYGLLELDGAKKFTQFSVQAFKVDTIVGFESWKLFVDFPKLLKALSDNLAISLAGIRMYPNGVLVWEEEKITLQKKVDSLSVAAAELKDSLFYKMPAFERHPTHLKVPLYFKGYQIVEVEELVQLQIGETTFPVDTHRFSSMSVLSVDKLKTSTECFGFLHFDNNQWRFQPLVLRCGRTTVHNGLAAIKAPAKLVNKKTKSTDSFKILKERAEKLLRS